MATLKKGSKGAEVSDLQTRLKKLGYQLDVDGVFGNVTYTVVTSFQMKYKLTADGIVGDETWSQLKLLTNKAIGKQVEQCLKDIENLPSVKKLVTLIG